MATAISPPAAGPPIDNHGAVSYLRVKADLHQQLLSDLDRRNLINAGEEDLAEVVEDFVDQALDGQDLALNDSERRQLVDDLLEEIKLRAEADERVLVTTLTKKMAENLTDYLDQMGVRVRYLHSDIETLERVSILRDLRLGEFDVLVGINLLREGLD